MTTKYVQLQNPCTKRWVKIDTQTGRITAHKKSKGLYKNIKVEGVDEDTGNLMKYGYSKEEIEKMDDDEFVYTMVMLADGMSKRGIDEELGK